jgi:hypothetical protein
MQRVGDIMAELLLKLTLKDQYLIYRDGGNYRVDQIDRRDQTHSVTIAPKVAGYLYQALRGSSVNVVQARDVLQNAPASVELRLPYTRGTQLGFYAQKVLLVLVALEKASYLKVGRAFIYTIK